MKIEAYKQTLKTISAYEVALEKGDVIQSKTIEEYKEKISKFVTKKGELRKNISQKNLEKFNKIVSDFKKSKFSKMSQLRKTSAKQEKSLVKNETVTSENVKNFRKLISQVGSKKIKIDSNVVVNLTEEIDETSVDDISSMLDHLKQMKENATPEELKSELMFEDEDFSDLQNIIDITKTMTEAEKKQFLKDIESSNEHWNKSILKLPKVKRVLSKLTSAHQKEMKNNILSNAEKWKEITKRYEALAGTRFEKLKTGNYRTRIDRIKRK